MIENYAIANTPVIKAGDKVEFIYEGTRMNGCVSCINHLGDGSIYLDIKCDGGIELDRIPFNSIQKITSEEIVYFGTDMILKNKTNQVLKGVLNSYYGINCYGYGNKKNYHKSIKAYQTEIESGDRKGLYTTVIFGPGKSIVVKKSADEADDILIAIAYAYMKIICSTNSHYKAMVDKNTVKIGKDYVIDLWTDFFVPGEILKRKRWDIYAYVAVQELFRKFLTSDIIDAIDNITYTVKEK